MKDLIVKNEKKLTTYLLGTFPNLSKNALHKALRKKDIRINDKRISEDCLLHIGDNIKVFICDEILEGNSISGNTASLSLSKSKVPPIIYEDENIIIVNKSTNIEVTGENSLTSTMELYAHEHGFNFVSPCHRLDRNTTGLVLFAKNEEALNILFQKFKDREIEKHYLATVYGIPNCSHKRMEAYLFKDSKKSQVYISDISKKGYQKIITSYSVISTNKKDNTSVLDVELETGRTHQIRAHLAFAGFPIVGDGKYGVNEINKKFKKKFQMLCAYKMKFCFCSPAGILEYLNGKEFKI